VRAHAAISELPLKILMLLFNSVSPVSLQGTMFWQFEDDFRIFFRNAESPTYFKVI